MEILAGVGIAAAARDHSLVDSVSVGRPDRAVEVALPIAPDVGGSLATEPTRVLLSADLAREEFRKLPFDVHRVSFSDEP
jgi:hypothetical protein